MALVPFDDRDGQIWWDGKLIPWRDAKLHVLTHGLHYGSGVFEGARAYGGNIFRLREHNERLIRSAALLDFKIPFSVDEIDQACIDTLAANGLTNAYVRPLAWRGTEQLAVAAPLSTIHFMVAVWEWPNLFGSDRMRGITLAMASWKRPHPETAPVQAKATGGYMTGTLSKNAAERDGFTDALMLDWRGQVAEATGANIFFVFDGALHTPIPDCSLDGITRKTVIALARKRGLTVVERAIMPDEMAGANEVFLTGTAAEVTPVRRIGELSFETGPISAALHADYEALVYLRPDEVSHRLAA
jgi:branched-chain amino acid aminotransferase